MPTPNICKEQSCNQEIRRGHHLCREHWEESEEGVIDECPQCGLYKDWNYPLCIECNKKAKAMHKSTTKPTADTQEPRRYDPARARTFEERKALLEDDPKAKDKRQLFDQQQAKCVYCGNVYPYNQLQMEHMIPKASGGQDNIRNLQLACGVCNRAKGTSTDIEFRREHARYLPQQERHPADPPIDPRLLSAPAARGSRSRGDRKEQEGPATLLGSIVQGIKDHFLTKGYCVRCARSVELNVEEPLCDGCYMKWSRYKNPDYEEKYCHGCGRETDTTYAKPFCRPCYKKLW